MVERGDGTRKTSDGGFLIVPVFISVVIQTFLWEAGSQDCGVRIDVFKASKK